MKKLVIPSLALAGTLALIAGFAGDTPNLKTLTGAVKIDGSSTVAPITTAVAEEFLKAAPQVRVTVGISGTGGGFKRFTVGDTDISDASRPIKKDEADHSYEKGVQFIELAIAFDGLSVVINSANTWCDTLTIDDLKKIFLAGSKVNTWKDIRPEWPEVPVKLNAPGTDSGTFDYFKEIIAGKDGAIRSDMTVSEDDNVLVRGVEGDKGGLGFFGYAYYVANKDRLKVVKIDGGKGPILPTHETIENGTYAPFSRPLFIYVNKASAIRPEVKAFVEFYLKECSRLVEEVGYVKLPQAILDRSTANFAKLKTGTQFLNDKGEKVSGPLSKVYN
jgi:phosphate transport system substrate-binding protein